MVEKSKVIGIMLQHSDGDKEYYEPELLKEDIEAIFKILEKYGDDNDSVRGDLKVIDQEENTEDIDSDLVSVAILQLDCKYYINCAGKCRSSSLWSDIDTIIKEMENIMDSFTEEEKPEWLTDADFEALKNEIKEIQEHEAENVQ